MRCACAACALRQLAEALPRPHPGRRSSDPINPSQTKKMAALKRFILDSFTPTPQSLGPLGPLQSLAPHGPLKPLGPFDLTYPSNSLRGRVLTPRTPQNTLTPRTTQTSIPLKQFEGYRGELRDPMGPRGQTPLKNPSTPGPLGQNEGSLSIYGKCAVNVATPPVKN